MRVKNIFPAYLAGFFIVWLYLLFTTTGVGVFATHWLYSVMMIFGATVAGFTPMGGGAVSYPVLSLYFNIDPTVARDFSLAIQAVGMTSASIYIMTRKSHSRSFYTQLPSYITISFIGFLLVTALYSIIPIAITKMLFVTLALAFISYYVFSKRSAKTEIVRASWLHRIIFCSIGGGVAALFGTGTDMLLYIMLNGYYGQNEKNATDLSIITMASISVLATLIHPMSPEVYPMWIAAAPVVAIFAPFGNKLLTIIKKYYMLLFVMFMNTFNYVYWMGQNTSLIIPSIICIISFAFLLTFQRYGFKSTVV